MTKRSEETSREIQLASSVVKLSVRGVMSGSARVRECERKGVMNRAPGARKG